MSTDTELTAAELSETPAVSALETLTLPASTPPRAEVPASAPAGGVSSIVRGSLWTIIGYGAGQILRLIGNVVVSRFVLPESFGIMALVNVFLQALVMFSDMGIEPSIIQHRRGDEPRFRNTAWTLQVIRGGLLFMAAALLSWPVAAFYGEPRLSVVLPVAALSAVIAGFNSTALFTVRRHLQLGRLTLLELTSQAVGLLVMLAWAWWQPTVWALVAGALATSVVVAVGSHRLIAGPRNRFDWEWEAFDELLRFGKWIFVSTLVMFCAWQVDRLLLGKLVSLEQLGIYSVGIAIATLPNLLLGMLAGAVQYPLLAKHGREHDSNLLEPLRAARRVLLLVGWAIILGVVTMGPTFFAVVYDARYGGAGPLAQWMSVAVWFMVLSTTAERVLPARGDPRGLATFNLVKLVATVPLVLLGFSLAELPGFILGIAAGAAVAHLWLLRRLAEHGLPLGRQDLGFTGSLSVVSLTVLALAALLEGRVPYAAIGLAAAPMIVALGYAYRSLHELRRWSHG